VHIDAFHHASERVVESKQRNLYCCQGQSNGKRISTFLSFLKQVNTSKHGTTNKGKQASRDIRTNVFKLGLTTTVFVRESECGSELRRLLDQSAHGIVAQRLRQHAQGSLLSPPILVSIIPAFTMLGRNRMALILIA
jgi:hypothetical protein